MNERTAPQSPNHHHYHYDRCGIYSIREPEIQDSARPRALFARIRLCPRRSNYDACLPITDRAGKILQSRASDE